MNIPMIDPNDDIENEKIIKKGFLLKKSKYLGNWKRRFVVLTNNYILAYTDAKPGAECTMNLSLLDTFGPKHLQLESQEEFGFSFCNDNKIYCFKTKNVEEKNDWFAILRESLSH